LWILSQYTGEREALSIFLPHLQSFGVDGALPVDVG
jgi:hypothetical protein